MSRIKKGNIQSFLDTEASALNTFRTLVLFGKNTATYKFALCDALLKHDAKSELYYHDLRDDFVNELVRHYKDNPNQFVRGDTLLTKAMSGYLSSSQDSPDFDELMKVAEKNIYNNVFEAFQNVGNGTIDDKYKLFEHDEKNRKLILTDNINLVLSNDNLKSQIIKENQSRWNVVEEAWRSGLSPNLLEYNEKDSTFFSVSGVVRVGLRAAIDVLIPYQKGLCFYCSRTLNRFTNPQEDSFPEVDHFLPFSRLQEQDNPNGVWNLVVACKNCNRGKSDSPPDKCYFEKLKDRNVLYLEEHKHSLRNSVLISLDVSNKLELIAKMAEIYKKFEIIKGWKPKEIFV
jgi:5-methylcytosine-specific restriction endonuclease McrA